ncbi:MAG: membrane integrity-associated transporter subunit PqiC, partial [Brachymonas sp.]|nr:membrane integrity-associated transporter subunit PqiC [Brachymonas sp.]
MTRAPSVSLPLHRCCRLAMALSAAVLLSACSILPSQTPMDTYVLPAPVTQQTPASAGANTGLALRITRPLVDGAIAGRRIVVMPQAGRISVYPGAIWSEPPAQLLRNRLI